MTLLVVVGVTVIKVLTLCFNFSILSIEILNNLEKQDGNSLGMAGGAS